MEPLPVPARERRRGDRRASAPAKLACPGCGDRRSRVADVRDHPYRQNIIWRMRQCVGCGQKYETNEAIIAYAVEKNLSE